MSIEVKLNLKSKWRQSGGAIQLHLNLPILCCMRPLFVTSSFIDITISRCKLSSSSSAWINSNMIMTVTHVNRLRHNNHHLHHLRLSGCIAGECRLVSSPSVFFLHLLLCPNREAKYCNKHVCMSVHLFAYLKNHTNKLQEIFRIRGHGSVLLIWQWNTLFASSLWMTSCFTHHGPYSMWHWQYLHECHAGATSHKFPTYSPAGATLFNFLVLYNGGKLHTAGTSDDDTWGAATDWWPTVCSIRAIGKVCSV